MIIANGGIRLAKGEHGGSGEHTLLCATGDIALPGPGRGSQFHAGGGVTLPTRPNPPDRVRENQAALPFGVRFLDPKEFGLEVVARDGGLQVAGLAPDSPFAGHGVERGDVIVRVDDVAADSVPAFRRQLRLGVLAESVVLRIRRGGREIDRVVFLDGIPAPVAPMPREARR